jgi:hypothetical protein
MLTLNTKKSLADTLRDMETYKQLRLAESQAYISAQHINTLCSLAALWGYGSLRAQVHNNPTWDYAGEYGPHALQVLRWIEGTGLDITQVEENTEGILFNIEWDSRLERWDGTFPSHLPQLIK